MKRCTQLLILALATSGLTLAACDPPESEEEEVEEEEEVAQEEEDEEEEEEEFEEPEFDQDHFILASYEINCVESEIEDEEQGSAIINEVLARYGYTRDSYDEATAEFADDESVELAIETRMEACDEDTALGFAEEGAGELEEGEEEDELDVDEEDAETAEVPEAEDDPTPQERRPTPEPVRTGTLTAPISGQNFEDAEIELRIRRDFDVSGQMRGQREGRDFVIPISGEVSEQGRITASGDRRGDSVEIDGRLSERGAEGSATGTVHDNSFNLRYRTE